MLKLLLLLGLTAAAAHDFTKCATTDHLGITGISLTPDPPVKGGVLAVALTGTTDEAITGGTATLKVKAFGVTIATQNFDVCKDLGLTCPVAAGTAFTAKVAYTIPSAAPSGITATCDINVVDASSAALGCYELKTKVGASATEQPTFLRVGADFVPTRSREEVEFMFEAWRREFNVEFKDAAETMQRMEVFADNLAGIEAHNAGDHTWENGLNEYGHLTWEEFRVNKLGFVQPKPNVLIPRQMQADLTPEDLAASPAAVDWTTKGAVTAVKNQQQCGSCWAFSTTGGLEGAYFLKNGKLQEFSEQQLVDCDNTAHGGSDQGCNGGLMDNAFTWIKKQGGICKEADYKYTGKKGSCKTSCTKVDGTTPKSFTDVQKNEKALKAALAKQPVSIAIEADQSGFQFYKSGVFLGKCGATLDHGVLAVGYGTDNGHDYWKVKNSWGATWGDAGYIRFGRGLNTLGECGILQSASYPNL